MTVCLNCREDRNEGRCFCDEIDAHDQWADRSRCETPLHKPQRLVGQKGSGR